MKFDRIYLSPPTLAGDEFERIKAVLESGWIAPLGPELDGFEADLEKRLGGARRVVGLSSGTAALHIALRLLDIQRGDSVWVASMTFIASANAIMYVGARPVFVDSDESTWCMDPELLRGELSRAAKKNELPKAIIPVDLYGQPASYDALIEAAQAYEIPIVADAAESLGATYGERPAGSLGDFAALSFNGNKIMTTSGGGALICSNDATAERARYFATQARLDAPHYQHDEIGYNYRLSNILAALGRSQLAALDSFIEKRRAIRAHYQEHLETVKGLSFMPEPSDRCGNAWLTCIQLDPDETSLSPTQIREALAAQNIESRPLWKPMHLQPVFADERMFGGSVSEKVFARGLCLPSGVGLSKSDLSRIVEIIVSLAKH